jgi:hypothetical protein
MKLTGKINDSNKPLKTTPLFVAQSFLELEEKGFHNFENKKRPNTGNMRKSSSEAQTSCIKRRLSGKQKQIPQLWQNQNLPNPKKPSENAYPHAHPKGTPIHKKWNYIDYAPPELYKRTISEAALIKKPEYPPTYKTEHPAQTANRIHSTAGMPATQTYTYATCLSQNQKPKALVDIHHIGNKFFRNKQANKNNKEISDQIDKGLVGENWNYAFFGNRKSRKFEGRDYVKEFGDACCNGEGGDGGGFRSLPQSCRALVLQFLSFKQLLGLQCMARSFYCDVSLAFQNHFVDKFGTPVPKTLKDIFAALMQFSSKKPVTLFSLLRYISGKIVIKLC